MAHTQHVPHDLAPALQNLEGQGSSFSDSLEGLDPHPPVRKRVRCESPTSQSPPGKTRSTSVDSDMEVEAAILGMRRRYRRDPTYYLEDGSCILLVEDTLFNVHRTILSKDSSSFSTMFTLPQGDQEAEGRSDENPIILPGDTASEFRNFLWALYALPPQLKAVHSPNADVNQLIDIAHVSNKYSYKSLETWALDAIQEYVDRKPSPILTSIPPPSTYTFIPDAPSTRPAFAGYTIESTAQLTRLIRLAQLCSHERLLDTMIGLLRQLMSSSLQYAYLAMTLADELGLKTLRGVAYLEVMHKAVVVKRTKVDVIAKQQAAPQGESVVSVAPAANNSSGTTGDQEGDIDEKGRLIVNRAQQLRLLSGYYRLTGTWERLRLAPPPFEHAASCSATWHQHGCAQSWLEFWKEKTRSDNVLAMGLADVLGRLRQVQKDYDRWGSATYMHHDCRMAARKSILEVIKSVEDALPDYFSDAGDED